MIRKIFGTTLTRISGAIMSFGILVINARELGAENVGIISLIILAVSLTLLVSNFMGGGALVYLVPRHDIFQLLFICYSWTFLASVMCAVLLDNFGLIPEGYTLHVMLLSLFQGLYGTNTGVLLGKEKIRSFNIISLLQIIILFGFVLYFIQFGKHNEVIWYVYALYVSYISAFVFSMISINKHLKISGFDNIETIITESLKYGAYVQMAAIAQMLNYRLSYYILERYFGKSTLGVFSVGTQISESVWLVGKSIATVQYSVISNHPDPEKSIKLTLSLLKLVFVITFLMIFVMILIPQAWYVLLLRKDFSEITTIILYLSPGIVAMAVSMMLSHYFSGTGRHYHNSVSSGIGLVITLVSGLITIPLLGITGAAITASISYTTSALYLLIVFLKISKVKIRELLVSGNDITNLLSLVKK